MIELDKYLPEKYRPYVAIGLLVIPYLTRAYHAYMSGGGLVGVKNGILFGTNVPKGTIAITSDEKSLS